MSWQCFIAETKEDRKRPGAMWYDPTKPEVWKMLLESDGYSGLELSRQYKSRWIGIRSPLYVCLPDGQPFCLDWIATGRSDGSGWDVTGDVPNVTVQPSINHNSRDRIRGWHGWLTNGVLTDDLEGRRYD